jgi:MFS family permease
VQLINTADFILVSVALPTIGRDLAIPTSTLGWVVSINALSYAGFLMLGGRLSDLFGQRRCTIIGVGTFGICSLAAAFAPNIQMLLVARALQGIANAIMVPATFTMLNTLLPEGSVRHRGYAVFGITQGISSLLGAGLGGILATVFGWRAVFLLVLPLTIVSVVIAAVAVPRTVPSGNRRPVDYWGAFLITASTTLVILGFSEMHKSGWGTSITGAGSLAAGCAVFLLFLLVESRVRDPLVPLAVFSYPNVMGPNIAIACGIVTTTGVMLLSNLYMQRVLGFSAMESGFGVIPFSLAGIAAGWCVGPAFARFSRRTSIFCGFGLYMVGTLLFATLSRDHAYLAHIGPGMALGGFGSIIGLLACMSESTAAVPPEHQGVATGLMYVFQKLGRAIGASVMLSLLSSGLERGGDILPTYQLCFLVLTGTLGAGVMSVQLLKRVKPRWSPAEAMNRPQP